MDKNRFEQELRNVLDTGDMVYGTKNVKKTCLVAEPKILVISNTISLHDKDLIKYFGDILNIKVVEYDEDSKELGSVCGKPFGISAIAINDYGKSDIVEAIEAKGEVKKVKGKVLKKKKKLERKRQRKEKRRRKKLKKKKEEEEKNKEVPITEDKMFKDILKVKKK